MGANMQLLITLVAVFFVAIVAVIAYVFYLTPNPHDDLR
jgi:hypothetical protein